MLEFEVFSFIKDEIIKGLFVAKSLSTFTVSCRTKKKPSLIKKKKTITNNEVDYRKLLRYGSLSLRIYFFLFLK